jgi:CubicO group peptidase (beta-lactamase class C family)
MPVIHRTICLLGALAVLAGGAAAQSPRADSLIHGFDPVRLQRIDAYLQDQVDRSRIAGAVALVLRDGQVVYERAVGWADREARRRMSTDAMFRIASQTKALTSVAIMMLVEEGKLALNNPVGRFLPSYARTRVMVDGTIVPARRAITIRDLLTQTAGISYGSDSAVAALYRAKKLGPAAGYGGWYITDRDEPVCATMDTLATLPFVRQPGDAWVYGYATDILGCVVERVSGLSLDEFFRTRITGPLDMVDTHFFVPIPKTDRLVAVYASDTADRISRAPDGALGQGHFVSGPRRNYSGGAGLVSTARDYARLLQMLLNGGELDGVRILSPATVQLMTTNQIGTLYPQPGLGFGLGFSIVERLGADNTLLSEGTYGWGGAYASQYRIDPAERVVLVFMLNQIPNRSDVASKFPTLVYQALVR